MRFPPPSPHFVRCVTRCTIEAIRLALAGLIIWLGIRLVCGDSSPRAGATGSRTRTLTFDPMKASDHGTVGHALSTGGYWTVADMDYGIGRTEVSEADASRRMNAIFPFDGHPTVVSSAVSAKDWQEIVAEAKQLEPVSHNGNLIYALNQPDVKARLIYRTVDGTDELVAGAVAFPTVRDRWDFVNLVPQATPHPKPQSHLLPLPSDARCSMARWSTSRQLIMEIISLAADAESLKNHWHQHGWEVRHSQIGSGEDFSYLCVRGEETIYVWSDDPVGSIQRLMLVRSSVRAPQIHNQ